MANVKLATASYALSAGGASGFSVMALSYAFSAPNDYAVPTGRVTLCITNGCTTAPIHVEMRSVWEGVSGVSSTSPMTVALLSNTYGFGGSAPVAQTLTLLPSGADAVLPYQFVAGSALQVWVLAASTVADAAGCSGQVTLWGN